MVEIVTHSEFHQDPCAMGVRELSALYRQRSLSPVEVVDATLARIERVDRHVNAYRAVMAESARFAARAAELQLKAGVDLGPLHGVPTSIKDNIHVRGVRTQVGSRSRATARIEQNDATVVHLLRVAGAVVIGKVNCDEFATGNPEPDDPYLVQNPRKAGHRTGGSSSGSAAAVAAGLGVLSVGTDTGGSIRHPASLCGVVGLRPTHGLVSTDGVIPFSPSMDVVGPLARSSFDAAAGLAALAGRRFGDYQAAARRRAPTRDILPGLRMGLATNRMYQCGHPEVLKALAVAEAALVDCGLRRSWLSMPRAEETVDVSSTLMLPELVKAVAQHAPHGSVFGMDLTRRLDQGREIGTSEYIRAQLARTQIRQEWSRIFEAIDVLVLPANLAGAPRHDDDTIPIDGKETEFRVVTSGTNRAASLIGCPALTVPIAATREGLPIGVQLIARPWQEAILFAVAEALEEAVGNLPSAWGIEPAGMPYLDAAARGS